MATNDDNLYLKVFEENILCYTIDQILKKCPEGVDVSSLASRLSFVQHSSNILQLKIEERNHLFKIEDNKVYQLEPWKRSAIAFAAQIISTSPEEDCEVALIHSKLLQVQPHLKTLLDSSKKLEELLRKFPNIFGTNRVLNEDGNRWETRLTMKYEIHMPILLIPPSTSIVNNTQATMAVSNEDIAQNSSFVESSLEHTENHSDDILKDTFQTKVSFPQNETTEVNNFGNTKKEKENINSQPSCWQLYDLRHKKTEEIKLKKKLDELLQKTQSLSEIAKQLEEQPIQLQRVLEQRSYLYSLDGDTVAPLSTEQRAAFRQILIECVNFRASTVGKFSPETVCSYLKLKLPKDCRKLFQSGQKNFLAFIGEHPQLFTIDNSQPLPWYSGLVLHYDIVKSGETSNDECVVPHKEEWIKLLQEITGKGVVVMVQKTFGILRPFKRPKDSVHFNRAVLKPELKKTDLQQVVQVGDEAIFTAVFGKLGKRSTEWKAIAIKFERDITQPNAL